MPEASLHNRTVGSQAPTKDRLIQAAARLFAFKGYNATSIDEIANACHIQKPSFYGHFPSKEAIAIAAVQNLHGYCKTHLFSVAHNAELSHQQRILLFTDALKNLFATRPDYALSTFLAAHSLSVVNNLTKYILDYFSDWMRAVTDLLRHFCSAEEANTIAQLSLCRIQGAIMMQRITDQDTYLENMCEELNTWWQSLLGNNTP